MVNQTLKDIEIIIIDDASTDNTQNIMENYKMKYSIIHCIYLKNNIGQGEARNIGIRIAKGEYIMFVDGDDWIDITMCEKDKAVHYFRTQKHDVALGIIAESMAILRKTIESIISDREYFNTVSADSVLDMLSDILEAYKKENYILLADLFEMQMVNFLLKIQELIISREEIGFDEEQYYDNLKVLKANSIGLDETLFKSIDPQPFLKEGYRVELTSCGLMTLAAENNGAQFYFHTNGRVQAEAFLLANNWYKEEIKEYILYGLGFGYHIKELLTLAGQAKITVYESDINIILLACAFTKIKEIFKEKRVKLIYDPEYLYLKNRLAHLSDKEIFYVHYPSFQNIRSAEGRKLTESYVSWVKSA